MKRFTGRNLKFIVITCCCLCITIINCDENVVITKRNIFLSKPENPKPQLSTKQGNDNPNVTLNDPLKKEEDHGSNVTTTQTTIQPQIPVPNLSVNTGALWRGASVFMGLTVLVIAYIIFRCSRLNKNRTQMVRKYGVLAHRQDVEMRPLPLDDEDEDDTTVFDASEIGVHDKHRQTA